MKASRFGAVTLLAALLVVGWSSSAQAQAAGGGQRGQRGQQGGGRGNFDPAQAREQYMTRLKEQLGATDEEWKALQPKVTKVMDARRDNRGGGGGRGGPGGPGGRRGGNNGADQTAAAAQPTTAVGQAEADLRKTVEDKSAAPEEINKKLAALREAREKAKSELTAAQKELKDLLSARQEAILVTNGLLE